MPLESPLRAHGLAPRAPPELAGCGVPCDVLGAPSGHPEDPVGVQAMLPGAGGHWKTEDGPGKGGLTMGSRGSRRSRRGHQELRTHSKHTRKVANA